jgi:dCMP deaminase
MPVYHQGYVNFFAKFPEVKTLVLLPGETLREYGPFHKDIHQIEPDILKAMLDSLGRFDEIMVADEEGLKSYNNEDCELIMPDEGALHMFKDAILPQAKVNWQHIFLRWDSKKASKENALAPDKMISREEFDRKFIDLAKEEGTKSSDWWRGVGAVLVDQDRQVIFKTHNHHLPSAHTPYINGDARAQFHKGDHIELTTSIHAEATIIALAAKSGIKVEGMSMYVTDFPCPACAKLIAKGGIKKLYYQLGYAVLDGESVLRDAGVEIVKVEQ